MLVAASLALMLAACATLPGGPTAGLLPTPTQAQERLEARRLAVSGFSMEGEINAQGPGGEISGEQRILGRFPDRLRAEVMGPFGKPALLFICDGARMAVLAYGENKGYVGPATRGNVARFLGLALTPAEVYTLLTGSVPLIPNAQARVYASSAPGQALLELDDGAGTRQGLIFSLGDYAVQQAWVSGPKGETLNGRFESFISQDGERRPRRVVLTAGDNRMLTLMNDEVRVNPALDEALFEPVLPSGVETQELP
ncbi:MAG: hypothetical protein ACOZHQ_02365 [Thermodesulfobacteriota bacterium]